MGDQVGSCFEYDRDHVRLDEETLTFVDHPHMGMGTDSSLANVFGSYECSRKEHHKNQRSAGEMS